MIKIKEKKADLAINEFVRRILEIDKEKIKLIRLYGSVIQGKYKPQESDIDILVIGDDSRIDNDILDLETEISLKYGVMLSVLFNTPQELKQIRDMGYPLIKEIEKGEVLYECS